MEVNEKLTLALALYISINAHDLECDENEIEQRMKICKSCDLCEKLPPPEKDEEEELMKEFGTIELHGCRRCGCMLEGKTKLFLERCPEEQWYPMITEDGSWKNHHEEFLKLYEKNGDDYLKWINYDIIDMDNIDFVNMDDIDYDTMPAMPATIEFRR